MKEAVENLKNIIEVQFANLDESGYFKEKTEDYKSFYAYLNDKYKNVLKKTGKLDFADTNLMSRYTFELEKDLLPSLKHLKSLSDLLSNMKKISENEVIQFDKITKTLNSFMYLYDKHNPDECEKVYEKLIEFLYKMVERETYELSTDNIISQLNDLTDPKFNFAMKIKSLCLKDLNIMSSKPIQASNNDRLDKHDFIDLVKARGLEYKEHKQPEIGFKKLIDISYGREIDCFTFRDKTKLNPLPKNDFGNQALRDYDLTNLNFYKRDTFKAKLTFRPFKNVNLSYTNAIVIPKESSRKHPYSLEGANLEGIDMRGLDLSKVKISKANLKNTGANITGAIGSCINVSPYIEPNKIFITNSRISPEEFKKITGQNPFPCNRHDIHEEFKQNMILRHYDINCIDYSKIDFKLDNFYKGTAIDNKPIENYTLDLSYTNANINPQHYLNYNSPILINLEGVDMRNKNFTGVERIFSMANLKGTGAKIDPSINPTVSEYIE